MCRSTKSLCKLLVSARSDNVSQYGDNSIITGARTNSYLLHERDPIKYEEKSITLTTIELSVLFFCHSFTDSLRNQNTKWVIFKTEFLNHRTNFRNVTALTHFHWPNLDEIRERVFRLLALLVTHLISILSGGVPLLTIKGVC